MTGADGGVVWALPPVQAVNRAYASTEPSPVTWSYPGPALYPTGPAVQLLRWRTGQVTLMMLLPLVTSWNAAGALWAKLYSLGLIFPRPGLDCTPFEMSH